MNKNEIEAEKDRLMAAFDEELNQKRKKLNDQIVKLEKQREKFLIDNKKGYNCKKCGKFVESVKHPLSHETHKMCWQCYSEMQKEKRKKEFLNKIRGAKITDVELTCYDSVKSLTVYKNGTMFRFKATTDDEVSYIELDDEWQEEDQTKIDRPGNKPRLEKPLVISE